MFEFLVIGDGKRLFIIVGDVFIYRFVKVYLIVKVMFFF